jgi:hypothetical protein
LFGLDQAGQGAASNLAGLGEQYAGMGTNTVMGAAGQVGNYLLDKGQAAAQGTLGSNNAWQNALNQLGGMGQVYGGGMNLFGGAGGVGSTGFNFPSSYSSGMYNPITGQYGSGYQPPQQPNF